MRESTTVVLSEMAEKLSGEYHPEEPIGQATPYDWWKRQKSKELSVPMPDPIRFVGRSPVFLWRDIRKWYGIYKGVKPADNGKGREK